MLSRPITNREETLDCGIITKLFGLNTFVFGSVVELAPGNVDREPREEIDEGGVLEKRPLLRRPNTVRNGRDEADVGKVIDEADIVSSAKEDILRVRRTARGRRCG